MRKQEIILFLYCATKCPTEAEKIDCENESIIDFGGQKQNQIQQNWISCTITANIWENNEK